MTAAERERSIVDAAIEYFAEAGLDAETRELARRIGITQPLVFHYFPTKQALIDKVFEKVYLRHLNPDWDTQLADRAVPLRERLIRFTHEYAEATFRYEWIRIYMFAGLKDGALNREYIGDVTEPLLRRICSEILANAGSEVSPKKVNPTALDLAWIWHGGLYYHAIRQHVYGMDLASSLDDVVAASVDMLICGLTHEH